jgi:hypothetical protein
MAFQPAIHPSETAAALQNSVVYDIAAGLTIAFASEPAKVSTASRLNIR